MKYGLIIDFEQSFCNYGDLVQSVAIELLYKQMEIPSQEIVYLTKSDLAVYEGEPILLPFSYSIFYLIDFKTKEPLLSDHIIPVFLGVTIESIFIYDCIPMNIFAAPDSRWMEMFRCNAPIGCRDEYTRQFMETHGISAYLQGCITNIFPHRCEGDYKKTLLVDCPVAMLEYIPEILLNNAESMTNVVPSDTSSYMENYRRVKERYHYYRDNAALVITTRYHVALPCNAMGIQSVVIKPPRSKYTQDIRWDTLPPQIQLCSSQSDYNKIDWYVRCDDFAEIKQGIKDLAVSRIKESFLRYSLTHGIKEFFRPSLINYIAKKHEHIYYKDILHKYMRRYHISGAGRFYIWGAINNLCYDDHVHLADIVININPAFIFCGWIDSFKTGKLASKQIYKINEINLEQNDFIIVAAESATSYALTCFAELGMGEQYYVLLYEEIFGENRLK